ncbi:MAG: hypothetical protein HZB26_14250, partial [Candidatus Hydrogenedentes bacterium]|nr:hypothetical protein [Candidatus Hydrogenedentota bacterium]
EQRAQDGRTLFWAGLWDDAFAAFTEAAKAGSKDSELDFFQGVALDIAGDAAGARALYTKTLTRLPNHLLSLRRLHMLLSAPTAG